jgi:hypothetical protein
MFGHNEKVVSIANFSAMKIFIAHHLLELIMVAEFSHRCEKLSKLYSVKGLLKFFGVSGCVCPITQPLMTK